MTSHTSNLDFSTQSDSERDMNNVDYMTMFTNWVYLSVFAPTSIVLLYFVITEK